MSSKIDIPTILKTNRSRLQFTQKQMGDYIGVLRGTYGAWEEGRSCPNIYQLVDLSRVLGFNTLDEFLMLKESAFTTSKIEQAYRQLPGPERKIVDFILKLN